MTSAIGIASAVIVKSLSCAVRAFVLDIIWTAVWAGASIGPAWAETKSLAAIAAVKIFGKSMLKDSSKAH